MLPSSGPGDTLNSCARSAVCNANMPSSKSRLLCFSPRLMLSSTPEPKLTQPSLIQIRPTISYQEELSWGQPGAEQCLLSAALGRRLWLVKSDSTPRHKGISHRQTCDLAVSSLHCTAAAAFAKDIPCLQCVETFTSLSSHHGLGKQYRHREYR
jgi:hypothetical protein